jgi:transcription antitermination factor NusG
MATEKRWYVIEAFQGEDEAAYLKLAAAFSETSVKVWRPVDVDRAPQRRAKRSTKPTTPRRDRRRVRFGRFLFVNAVLTDSLYHAIRNAHHVRKFLTYAGSNEPAAQPDALIEFYREEIPTKRELLPMGLAVGAIVRIEHGPFIGLNGRVASLDERGTVEVEISIFGRPTPIVIEVGHVSVEVAALAKPPARRAFIKATKKLVASAKLSQA